MTDSVNRMNIVLQECASQLRGLISNLNNLSDSYNKIKNLSQELQAIKAIAEQIGEKLTDTHQLLESHSKRITQLEKDVNTQMNGEKALVSSYSRHQLTPLDDVKSVLEELLDKIRNMGQGGNGQG